ncbi:arylamine N-acetyltransferase [Streptomyces sp. NPDC102476]|uniref:arylamine N-acetyltransferase family protein n=1 Tax=Streptomyces sp. NPDC102476 TaxID=3366181 RepID=UPI00381DAB1C
MNPTQVDAYLRRLGVQHPAWPTVEVLRELHLRHLQTVPFENLSVHLGEEIVLEEERLVEKVVGARRGGFCYELNGAFGALLAALGFDVTLLAGRVYGDEGRLGIPYDHLALRVRTVDGGEWLADVGFGAHSHYPLAFGARDEQEDPGGTFRIVEAGPDAAGVRSGDGAVKKGGGDAADLDVLMGGRSQYRLEVRPRVLGDFVAGAWWHSTSSASHFTRSLVCSRVTEDGGRITLSGRTFKVTAADGAREERELETDEEVLEVYRERFGVELDRVPAVRHPDGNGGVQAVSKG